MPRPACGRPTVSGCITNGSTALSTRLSAMVKLAEEAQRWVSTHKRIQATFAYYARRVANRQDLALR